MFCKKCGTEISEDSKFCPSCGASQIETTVEQIEPKMAENVSPKSRLAALLFGIFLGEIGVHNFYLGFKGKGISKILMYVVGVILYCGGITKLAMDGYNDCYSAGSIATFSGLMIFGIILLMIPGIWAFVEWILIACGKAKDSKGLSVIKWQ